MFAINKITEENEKNKDTDIDKVKLKGFMKIGCMTIY